MASAGDRKECDLVMEGGITSGVVYPAAIAELHERYDFRCIGGASAGAIAAAATAAAQLRWNREPASRMRNPFGELRALTSELARPGRLVKLFVPERGLGGPLRIFLAALEAARAAGGQPRWLRVVRVSGAAIVAAWLAAPVASASGAVLGMGLAYGLVRAVDGEVLLGAKLVMSAGAIVGALGGALAAVVHVLLWLVPRHGFGLSAGHSNDPSSPALTDWLAEKLDRLAGLDPGAPPLTFGDLTAHDVTLQMVTTNLTERRPYVVPFEHHTWVFRRDEMERLFPAKVVEHLVAHAHASEEIQLPEGFHFLPDAAELPVIVAVRLSLSFPVLVSAVPLHRLDETRLAAKRAQRLAADDLVPCVFSDGGICSNFPIHFFDRWIPTRPTFGISLVEAQRTADPAERRVRLPKANRPERPRPQPIDGLPSFFTQIFRAAKDHRDTLQRELPSYRERVVQIALRPNEGGLNLDMPAERIERLRTLGGEAGRLLHDFDFAEHLWVRLRVLLPRLSEEIEALARTLDDDHFDVCDLGWELEARGEDFPYRKKEPWREEAQAFLRALGAAKGTLPSERARDDEPKPPLTLRATPRT